MRSTGGTIGRWWASDAEGGERKAESESVSANKRVNKVGRAAREEEIHRKKEKDEFERWRGAEVQAMYAVKR